MPPPRQDADVARVCGILGNLGLVRNNRIFPLALEDGAFAQQTETTLVPQYLSALVPSKKAAFTLAEVLITLGIIGVVAAITIPATIANYQQKVTVTKLKQTYSLLTEALEQAKTDYRIINNWILDKNFADKYFTPYLKVVKEFYEPEYTIYCKNGKECNNYGLYESNAFKKIVLANGTMIYPAPLATEADGTSMTILVDINGSKGPNKYGRDVFAFSFAPKYELIGYGSGSVAGEETGSVPEKTREYLLDDEYRSCNKDGVFCAAVIMMDGWQISSDYKW